MNSTLELRAVVIVLKRSESQHGKRLTATLTYEGLGSICEHLSALLLVNKRFLKPDWPAVGMEVARSLDRDPMTVVQASVEPARRIHPAPQGSRSPLWFRLQFLFVGEVPGEVRGVAAPAQARHAGEELPRSSGDARSPPGYVPG